MSTPIDRNTEFVPHPLLRGPHAQTIAAIYWPGPLEPYRARTEIVELPDGDKLMLHDDQPVSWLPGDRVVLMLHGLAGSHASPYLRRLSTRLVARGVRTFRMDLRGCGAGAALARRPYHGGCFEDLAAAVAKVRALCPRSPLSALGFSLGGNVLLRLLGEWGGSPDVSLDRCMAVCPPIDLANCARRLKRRANRLYDQFFVRVVQRQLRERRRQVPDALHVEFTSPPKCLEEFDDRFTSQVWGYGSAERYYRACSSGPLLASIRTPVLILAAEDDPLIGGEVYHSTIRSERVSLRLTQKGGHMGFLARRGADPDRRWMEWRVMDYLLG